MESCSPQVPSTPSRLPPDLGNLLPLPDSIKGGDKTHFLPTSQEGTGYKGTLYPRCLDVVCTFGDKYLVYSHEDGLPPEKEISLLHLAGSSQAGPESPVLSLKVAAVPSGWWG